MHFITRICPGSATARSDVYHATLEAASAWDGHTNGLEFCITGLPGYWPDSNWDTVAGFSWIVPALETTPVTTLCRITALPRMTCLHRQTLLHLHAPYSHCTHAYTALPPLASPQSPWRHPSLHLSLASSSTRASTRPAAWRETSCTSYSTRHPRLTSPGVPPPACPPGHTSTRIVQGRVASLPDRLLEAPRNPGLPCPQGLAQCTHRVTPSLVSVPHLGSEGPPDLAPLCQVQCILLNHGTGQPLQLAS